jgi:tRNA (guanine37-N1)-methyltransferase
LRKAAGVAIPQREVQRTIRILRKMKVVDNTLRLARTGDNVLIPILRKLSAENILEIKELCAIAEITEASFEEIETRPRSLLEALRGKIPESFLPSLPHSFDIIGDIAIIELRPELTEFSSTIGGGIMEVDPHLRLVLKKSGEVSGTFRTRKLEVIAGAGSTETVHREFSCLFRLDVAKAYFNPRLSHERMRVARQVKEGEHVLDMFAGVGPYSILIAKTQHASKVYSVDINPEAFRYLKHNILLNRVADRVVPLLGDAHQLALGDLSGRANRVIMNLPSESTKFLDAAVQALGEDGGVIHYYAFASRSENLDEIGKAVRSAIDRQGRTFLSFPFSDTIKDVAPNRVQVAVDALVK